MSIINTLFFLSHFVLVLVNTGALHPNPAQAEKFMHHQHASGKTQVPLLVFPQKTLLLLSRHTKAKRASIGELHLSQQQYTLSTPFQHLDNIDCIHYLPARLVVHY